MLYRIENEPKTIGGVFKDLECQLTIEMILKKNLSSDDFIGFYAEPKLSGVDLIFPIIPSWTLLQESKQNNNSTFNNETKIISLKSASGSHYRCILPSEKIVDKFNKWLEYKKEQENIEKQFEDLQQEIDDVPNPYESELINKET